jgi:hypothetical protein
MPETGQQDRFRRSRLAGTKHVTSAMHMNEQAVSVFGRDRVRRQHECVHARNRGRFDLDVQALPHAGQQADGRFRAGGGGSAPFGDVFRQHVPARPEWRRNERLELRARGQRHRD